MCFSDIDTGWAYLESFINLEKTAQYTVRTYRLDRMAALLEYFGHPEKEYLTIHIAGSKGKGSTAAFIQAGLTASGEKTGLYTSPHISNYRERFTVDGSFIPDDTLLSTMNAMAARLEDFTFAEETGYSWPTAFELFTLYGFLLFRDTGCTWAVIETGLGGRLDATNVITPVLSVITTIELEHTAVLGDTIPKIAAEKAGIIKPEVPVALGYLKPEAEAVMMDFAGRLGAGVSPLRINVSSLQTRTLPDGEHCRITWVGSPPVEMVLRQRGSFQAENAALALLALEMVGLPADPHIIEAIEKAALPGRMELVCSAPPVYLDGAHTMDSITRLYDSFTQLYEHRGILVFGAVVGKNHAFMAEHSVRQFGRIVISTPGTFKPSDPAALYALFLEKKRAAGAACDIRLIPDPAEAFRFALQEAAAWGGEPSTPILVTGSFYMCAEIRKLCPDEVLQPAVQPEPFDGSLAHCPDPLPLSS